MKRTRRALAAISRSSDSLSGVIGREESDSVEMMRHSVGHAYGVSMTDTGVRYDETNPWSVFIGTHINNTPGRVTMTGWGTRLGVSRDTLYRWLRGEIRTITVEVAERVAAGFGVAPELALDAARRAKAQPGTELDDGQALQRAASQIRPASLPRDTGPVPPTFGPWLTKTRQNAGFATSDMLARAADLGANLVASWEDGTARPEIWEALVLARVLGVSQVDALTEAGYIRMDPAARALQDIIERRPSDDPTVDAIRRLVESERDRR